MSSPAIPATYARRLTALNKGLDAAEVDALLVSYGPDQFYLTGAVIEDSAVLVARLGGRRLPRVVILTDSRFDEQVALQAPWAEKILRTDSLPEAVLKAAADLRIKPARLGLDEHLPLGQYDLLTRKRGAQGALTSARHVAQPPSAGKRSKTGPTAGFKITSHLVADGRQIKDDAEVAAIVRAIRAAERGYLATLPSVRPGVRENEIAAELEYQMRLAGASGSSFEPIVAAGPRASLPHARATAAKLRPGQGLLFDWGAKVDGYCSDLTRVVAVGKAGTFPPAIRNIYPIVLEAQLAGIAAIRSGARCQDVDRAARQVIEQAGFGPQFAHGLGHGLGLDVHERPRLGAKSEDVLAAGMVVTVEPGIYLPGVGGVRIEDDVLVTPTGRRVLSKLGKTLA